MVQNAAKNAAKRSIPGGFCSFSASSTTAAPPPVYPRRLLALQRTWWLYSGLIPLNGALHLLQLNTGFDFVISTFVGGRRSAAKGASNRESTRTYKKRSPRGGGRGTSRAHPEIGNNMHVQQKPGRVRDIRHTPPAGQATKLVVPQRLIFFQKMCSCGLIGYRQKI